MTTPIVFWGKDHFEDRWGHENHPDLHGHGLDDLMPARDSPVEVNPHVVESLGHFFGDLFAADRKQPVGIVPAN